MEKNRMMRLASTLLVLTLLTTCMISGTFAKYTTKAEGSDTARVAKWGVTVNVTSDLFANAYENTSVGYTGTTATVKASAENQNIVAPGTTGTGLGVTSGGTPEVSYEMKIKLDGTTAKMPSLKYTPTSGTVATYEPVKFSVLNGTTQIKANMTLVELKTLFDGTKAIYKYDVGTGEYYVDSNGDGTIDTTTGLNACPNIQIKWEWAFEPGTDAGAQALNNELDTILGDTAAATSGAVPISSYSAGTISDINTIAELDWTVTATQID